jgi:Domain of unknown function (DUF4169)
LLHVEKTFPWTWNLFPCGTFTVDTIWMTKSAQRLHENLLGDTGERGHSIMIQCHGIGVIEFDEWVSPDPRTCIRIPSIVHMAKVINLRAARKRATRLQDEQRAAEHRAQFGRPKAERLLVKARGEKARREVDNHRIGNGEGR